MERLPKDLLQLIALQLEEGELIELSGANRRFRWALRSDEAFLKARFLREFPLDEFRPDIAAARLREARLIRRLGRLLRRIAAPCTEWDAGLTDLRLIDRLRALNREFFRDTFPGRREFPPMPELTHYCSSLEADVPFLVEFDLRRGRAQISASEAQLIGILLARRYLHLEQRISVRSMLGDPLTEEKLSALFDEREF